MCHKIVVENLCRGVFNDIETAKEFKKYEYELDKDGNPTSVYPDNDNHSIDAVRYGLERVWKRKGK